jgi:4-hydroxy-tetrahydrodipicolinate synthase
MKKTVFTGSAVAIVTPFTDNGTDYNKLAELIEFQIANETDAIVICGTTGESSTMPDCEHKEVIRFAVQQVAGRVPVIAGTGVNDTRHAIELSQYAQEAGADAVLCVTPYYNKTTQKGLVAHFTAIAKSISIPVIMYNVPSRTNLNIEPAAVIELAAIDNIVAIKECNFNQAGEIINACGPDFTVYSGEDALALPLLSLGGKGVISVMANIIPKDTHDICRLFFDGDLEGSRKLQLRTTPLIKALFAEVSPIPVKAAMNLMGMNAGTCRLPLIEASEAVIDKLKKVMSEYGLI